MYQPRDEISEKRQRVPLREICFDGQAGILNTLRQAQELFSQFTCPKQFATN